MKKILFVFITLMLLLHSLTGQISKDATPGLKDSQGISLREHEYAVIINGGQNKTANFLDFWNECAAIYTALIHVYHYKKENIYILISDGTDPEKDRCYYYGCDSSPLDLDGDGVDDTQYAATKENISLVFDHLAQIMTNEDNLFIYATSHGSQRFEEDVYMYLWENVIMEDYEFAAEVNKVNAAQTINILITPCSSGGFIDDLAGNNRVITTSCKANENTHSMSQKDYGEFAYYWASAIAGHAPDDTVPVNADNNQDGIISMKEAYLYAKIHDTQPYETPQYSSPEDLGDKISLDCFPIYYFTNKSVTTNTDLTICRETNIRNVAISNGTSFNLYSGEKVTIKPNFHAESGTNVHITVASSKSNEPPQNSMLLTNNEPKVEEPYVQSLLINDTDFVNQNPKFSLYPNPNPGTFQIETNFPLTEIGNLKITNLMGATVYETQNVASSTIQLQSPSSGTFFVVMILKDGAVLTRKMVVQ
jgi:hypothetical protein